MKKLLLLAGLGALVVQQALAFPFSVTVDRVPGYFSGSGGEFTISCNDPAFTDIWDNYSPKAQIGGAFQTFCADRGIGISIPIDVTAVLGGQVNYRVGYLYSEFAKGTLLNYDYGDPAPGADRDTDAYALQQAIYALLGQTANAGAAAEYVALANAAPVADYDVYMLRLFDKAGRERQPMLVYLSSAVPDGGLTILLLGGALTGLAFIRRKR